MYLLIILYVKAQFNVIFNANILYLFVKNINFAVMRLVPQVTMGHFQRVQESQDVSQARYQQGSGSSDGFPLASLFFS